MRFTNVITARFKNKKKTSKPNYKIKPTEKWPHVSTKQLEKIMALKNKVSSFCIARR
jgi:hypothetical protein